ncbi:MAG: SIR2 family protein [Magnetococcales bacterium]|nr:SIR2 family protein [Magnetococcales bacterium]
MNIDKLKKRLQNHLQDGLVIIVGSGLSCAEGLPGMSDIAIHLENNLPQRLNDKDKEYWKELLPNIKINGLEAALMNKPLPQELEMKIIEITATLVRDRERQAVKKVLQNEGIFRFGMLLDHLIITPTSGLSVVTTNYDRLIEFAVEFGYTDGDFDLGVNTMFVGQFVGKFDEKESKWSLCRGWKKNGKDLNFRNHINIYKPHGSLDWYERNGHPIRHMWDLSLPPLIITPGINKYKNGYERPFDRHRELANAAIDQAKRFLIIGYGFNDNHLETHLTKKIYEGTPTVLLTQGLTDKSITLTNNCPHILSLDREIRDNIDGTRVITDGNKDWIPNESWWDLRDFVVKVIES